MLVFCIRLEYTDMSVGLSDVDLRASSRVRHNSPAMDRNVCYCGLLAVCGLSGGCMRRHTHRQHTRVERVREGFGPR